MTKVEIVEQCIPLPPHAQGDRQVADRLDNLGLLPKVGEAVAGYEVRINGTPLPVAVVGYEVGPSEAGTIVTLVVPADEVAIRKASAADEKISRTWQPGSRDPRADIPGWTPEVVLTHAPPGAALQRNLEMLRKVRGRDLRG
ncbi:hypothetical protein [Polymorphospora lycopeni]|uniref:Uncharacterized protein n=1 Tax=Polymorphospora lycopeni TaxID=3140240 RepID=A0ABV5CKW9_9ACTN